MRARCDWRLKGSPYPCPHAAYASALLEYHDGVALGAELARGGQACGSRTDDRDACGSAAPGHDHVAWGADSSSVSRGRHEGLGAAPRPRPKRAATWSERPRRR